MVSRPVLAALICGVAAAVLFVFIIIAGLGPPFILAPTLPLFLHGLRYGAPPMAYGVLAGGIVALLVAGVAGCLFFLGLIGLPALLFSAVLTQRRHEIWQPLGVALVDLTIYAALGIAGFVLHFAGEEGGLKGVITAQLLEQFSTVDPAMRQAMEAATSRLQFLIVGASTWWWVLLLYAHAWLANWILKINGYALRPNLILAPFHLHIGWLAALAAAAAASLAGDTVIGFLGQALFITFLLPYFLLGITILHSHVKAWPHKGLLLFVLYAFMLTQFWPALIIAGMGIWRQVRTVKWMTR